MSVDRRQIIAENELVLAFEIMNRIQNVAFRGLALCIFCASRASEADGMNVSFRQEICLRFRYSASFYLNEFDGGQLLQHVANHALSLEDLRADSSNSSSWLVKNSLHHAPIAATT